MLKLIQLNYLKTMPEDELLGYISSQDSETLEKLKKSVSNHIETTNDISRDERDIFLTIISFVDARITGLKEENHEELTLMIDISQFKPLSKADLIEVLGLTIKKDNENKVIAFLCMISAYTQDSQFNLSFNAPSSSGKSFIPTEIANLFPKEDVLEIGYCSPTAFFHDTGKYDKEKNELIIDFTGKIIIFLDQPHTLLLQHLRPLLSHDKHEIRIKITDKSQKAGLRTKNVVLRGYPAVIFCTAGLSIDEQESTRFILLSPEINQEKIREAIQEKIKRSSDTYIYQYDLETHPLREQLKQRIRAIKQADISEIIIKDPKRIEEMFFGRAKILKPRHQRDIGRVISLIKVLALLNVWFREREGSSMLVSEEDIQQAFQLYDVIAISQELNLPPYVYDLYIRVILPAYQDKNPDGIEITPWGVSRQEVMKKHYETYGRYIPLWQLRQEIIPMLETAGLITQEPDQNNKRVLLIYPTTQLTLSKEQEYSEVNGGVREESHEK